MYMNQLVDQLAHPMLIPSRLMACMRGGELLRNLDNICLALLLMKTGLAKRSWLTKAKQQQQQQLCASPHNTTTLCWNTGAILQRQTNSHFHSPWWIATLGLSFVFCAFPFCSVGCCLLSRALYFAFPCCFRSAPHRGGLLSRFHTCISSLFHQAPAYGRWRASARI